MACPLFLPSTSRGDHYRGECAAGAEAMTDDTLRRCCNRGYARGCCEHAAQADVDAFRFLIKADQGGVIDVAWSSERNHHPVAVGVLPVDGIELIGGPLERQARAYAAAYRRQNGR